MPMTVLTQQRVFVLCEVCNAWAALDVFVFSIFIALTEVRRSQHKV